MSKEYPSIPPESFNEQPWIPNDVEIEELGSLSITPSEALTLLIEATNNHTKIDPAKKAALEAIRDSDEPMDFIRLVKQAREEDDDD
jgi:hypothetical protein